MERGCDSYGEWGCTNNFAWAKNPLCQKASTPNPFSIGALTPFHLVVCNPFSIGTLKTFLIGVLTPSPKEALASFPLVLLHLKSVVPLVTYTYNNFINKNPVADKTIMKLEGEFLLQNPTNLTITPMNLALLIARLKTHVYDLMVYQHVSYVHNGTNRP